VKEKTKRW